MLIYFSVENWASFRDKAVFYMDAGRERRHGWRVPRLRKYRTRVLPIAVLYGGNAAGKTNLFQALEFVQRLVVDGDHADGPIPVRPFRLDDSGEKKPTRFCIELLADETMYQLSFAVTRKAVLEEKLIRFSSTSEKTLYARRGVKISFDKSLLRKEAFQDVREKPRGNQLLLGCPAFQQAEDFQPVYGWFKDVLKVVGPDANCGSLEPFFDEKHPLHRTMNSLLGWLDTGIDHLDGKEVPPARLQLPEGMKTRLREEVKEDAAVYPSAAPDGRRFSFARKGGKLLARQLGAFHRKGEDEFVRFDLAEESAGTRRLISLLPAFLDLIGKGSKRVYVIDDMDRNLHTQLSCSLLEYHLYNCSTETRSQLLLAAHDAMLIDKQLLRCDEIWVVERRYGVASHLIPVGNYKDICYDKDIRRSYLGGYLGGLPNVLAGSHLPIP